MLTDFLFVVLLKSYIFLLIVVLGFVQHDDKFIRATRHSTKRKGTPSVSERRMFKAAARLSTHEMRCWVRVAEVGRRRGC